MLSLSITDPVKQFMNRLLREDLFDAFEMREAVLIARTRSLLYGALEDEAGGYVAWGGIRAVLTEIIKHGGKPRSFKITFSADNAVCAGLHDNAQACFVNIVYENDAVTVTTAASQKEFAMDKTLDAAWDTYVQEFFTARGIGTAIR
jgi:hypothetical protein